jgi:hypothetical protein
MGERIRSEVSKLDKGKSRNLLEHEIERYLRVPFYMLIILIVFNGLVYAFDRKCGFIITGGMLIYLLTAIIIYYKNRVQRYLNSLKTVKIRL